MLPLRSLWVNGEGVGPREAWWGAFDTVCDLREIEARQLGASEAERDWDLVCFNFDFPEMAGLKLVPQCKQRWPSAPIVMFTMQCSSQLAIWALRARVFDLLVKPIQPHEVDRCLQRVFEAVRARRTQTTRRPQTIVAQVPIEARFRPRTPAPARLQRVVAHIEKHYARHVSESEVAQVCEMSPSRFCREFKSAFGMTFIEYLSRHRVLQAKRLLGNRGMSVSDVAAAVGFADPSYFTRVFRRIAGDSPSGFRDVPLGAIASAASMLESGS